MQKDGLVEKVSALIQPIADELNYELYYVEYVKIKRRKFSKNIHR